MTRHDITSHPVFAALSPEARETVARNAPCSVCGGAAPTSPEDGSHDDCFAPAPNPLDAALQALADAETRLGFILRDPKTSRSTYAQAESTTLDIKLARIAIEKAR